MNFLIAVRALGPIDLKSVRRDPLLLWMIAIAIPLALLTRWGVPALARHLLQTYQFDLIPYYPLLMSCNLLMLPILVGIVIGFLLLDERDDQTLSALQVTPLPLGAYLAYRIAAPLLLSVVLTVVVLEVAALTPLPLLTTWVIALAVAPLAPLFALFLAAFAGNKVQGLALTKVNSVLTIPPVVAWFVTGNWQYAFGLAPTYWSAKAYWLLVLGGPHPWLYAFVGVVFQGAVLAALLGVFLRRTHQ